MNELFLNPQAAEFVAEHRAALEDLSPREVEVFRAIGLGQDTALIARALHLSNKTVQAHTGSIKRKFGFSLAQLRRLAYARAKVPLLMRQENWACQNIPFISGLENSRETLLRGRPM